MREAMELAEERGMELVRAMADIFAPEGETWDVERITDDREFIAFYVDLGQRPSPEMSILHMLPTVSPEVYRMLTARFERARMNVGV